METTISPFWPMIAGFLTAIFIIGMTITDNGDVVWLLILGAIFSWIAYLVISWIFPSLFPGICYYAGLLCDLVVAGFNYLTTLLLPALK